MKTIAIVPARAGSKRIKGKNAKHFLGKPIILYSLEAARSSGLFDRVIVSTDSEEIASLARSHGFEVPFLRSGQLSDDRTPLTDVLLDGISRCSEIFGEEYGHACLILATAPFVTPEIIAEGGRLLKVSGANAVVPVTAYDFPIFRAMKTVEDGSLTMVWPEHEFTHSNQLPETFHDVGQFYWVNVESFKKERRLFAKGARPLFLPKYLVQDIDTEEDWIRAEMLYSVLQQYRARKKD